MCLLLFSKKCLVRLIYILSLESLERSNRHNGNQSEQLVNTVLIFVSFAGESNSNTERDIADTLRPDEFVQASFNANIVGAHLLLCKQLDLFDGSWGTLLEADAMQSFVKVDGVLAGDHFVQSRFAFLVATCLVVNHF